MKLSLFKGIIIGTACNKVESLIVRDLFSSFNDCILLSLNWIIHLAPIGIASLVIDACFEMNDFGSSFKRIGIFALVCSISIITYGTLVQIIILFIFMRGIKSKPFIYYFHFIEPAIIAAATTSGYVTMQTAIEVCERKLNMDTRISRFSIPFFVTLEVLTIIQIKLKKRRFKRKYTYINK